MRFLITGYNGQLGYDVVRELERRGYKDFLATTRSDMDITDSDKVMEVVCKYKPNIIIHCAAYTAVDKAEEDKDNCYNINVNGTKNIVNAAREVGAKVIYIGTDYVFDGTKDGYYLESDKINPINYYGETKYLGEEEVSKYNNYVIARISWVFGINGNNFVKTMLKLADTHDEISVVSDQVGSPTYTSDLAKVLIDISLSDKTGIYHITNDEVCSWYEFAGYILKDKDIKINPIKSVDYPTKAKRPFNSKLSKDKLVNDGFSMLPSWKDAIDRYMVELRKEDK